MTKPVYYIANRVEDETGVSGTGTVFVAVDFGEKVGCVAAWRAIDENFNGGTYTYDSIEQVELAHGHGGKTKLTRVSPHHPSMQNYVRVTSHTENPDMVYFVINNSAAVAANGSITIQRNVLPTRPKLTVVK